MKKAMKKLFLIALLLVALALPVFAVEEAPYLHPESHWLVMDTDRGLQVLAAEYVLDFHWDETTGTVYYTALEDGEAWLRAVQVGCREGRTIPLELEAGQLTLLNTPSQSTEKMVDAAMTIIYRNEGSYGSINKDDNGAVSIGKVQWHGNRALNLLKTIVKDDPDTALALLGEDLYEEILTEDSWGSRTVNEEEALAISALLKTQVGKAAQDALAATDITSYVNHALNLGLRSSTAMVYFADLENQFGPGGAADQAKKAKDSAGSYEAVTLDILHQAALDYSSRYNTRRKNVYNYCLSLGWDEFALLTPQRPTAEVTGKTVRLSWPAVEQAERYECFIKVVQGAFVDVCSVETAQPQCTVTLEPGANYCAYVVAKSRYSTSDTSMWAIFDLPLPVCQAAVETTQAGRLVQVTLTHGDQSYQILAAGYRQGRLVALGMTAWDSDGNTFNLEGELDEIRIMVADGTKGWMPLCRVQVIDCTPEEVPPEEAPAPEESPVE